MKKLIEGVLRFQKEIYPKQKALYQELAEHQTPRWLVITCSDSRVVPNVMAQAGPGELFTCRNAGNIVPAYGEHSGGVSATIEYAVQVLKVPHIIVCGHSDCGAMHAVLHPETVAHLPAVNRWINYAASARAVVMESAGNASETDLFDALTDQNVVAQLDNLRTIPCVAAKLHSGALHIHGWVYDIRTGKVRVWDAAAHCWHSIDELVSVEEDPTPESIKHATS